MSKTQTTVIPSGGAGPGKVDEYSFSELSQDVVIKLGQADSLEEDGFRLMVYGGRVEDPMERAKRQAEELIAQAQAGLDEARAQVEVIRKQAREEGYEEGHRQGLADGLSSTRARVEAICDNLGRVLAQLDQVKAGVLAGMESELVALVQASLDQVLGAVQPFASQVVREVVVQAIARLSEAESVVVHLNPSDQETMEEFRPDLVKRIEGLNHLSLKADDAIHPGGARVETPTEMVDATLESRRERILRLLAKTHHQAQPSDLADVLEQATEEEAPDLASPGGPQKENV